jgi:hypothetical protein
MHCTRVGIGSQFDHHCHPRPSSDSAPFTAGPNGTDRSLRCAGSPASEAAASSHSTAEQRGRRVELGLEVGIGGSTSAGVYFPGQTCQIRIAQIMTRARALGGQPGHRGRRPRSRPGRHAKSTLPYPTAPGPGRGTRRAFPFRQPAPIIRHRPNGCAPPSKRHYTH